LALFRSSAVSPFFLFFVFRSRPVLIRCACQRDDRIKHQPYYSFLLSFCCWLNFSSLRRRKRRNADAHRPPCVLALARRLQPPGRTGQSPPLLSLLCVPVVVHRACFPVPRQGHWECHGGGSGCTESKAMEGGKTRHREEEAPTGGERRFVGASHAHRCALLLAFSLVSILPTRLQALCLTVSAASQSHSTLPLVPSAWSACPIAGGTRG
jgi:hypothetical protein